MKMMIAGVCLGLAMGANATIITESECNNNVTKAGSIVAGVTPWSNTGVMTLASNGRDVDFFSIVLNQGQTLTVTATPLTTLFTTPDTYLGILDSVQAIVASNDNSFGNGSTVFYQAPADGTYYIAVTGSSDTNFDGYVNGSTGHGKVGAYQLTVSLVPEPATMALMGLMGIGLLARRKK